MKKLNVTLLTLLVLATGCGKDNKTVTVELPANPVEVPKAEVPKVEIPKIEVPKFEVPKPPTR